MHQGNLHLQRFFFHSPPPLPDLPGSCPTILINPVNYYRPTLHKHHPDRGTTLSGEGTNFLGLPKPYSPAVTSLSWPTRHTAPEPLYMIAIPSIYPNLKISQAEEDLIEPRQPTMASWRVLSLRTPDFQSFHGE